MNPKYDFRTDKMSLMRKLEVGDYFIDGNGILNIVVDKQVQNESVLLVTNPVEPTEPTVPETAGE